MVFGWLLRYRRRADYAAAMTRRPRFHYQPAYKRPSQMERRQPVDEWDCEECVVWLSHRGWPQIARMFRRRNYDGIDLSSIMPTELQNNGLSYRQSLRLYSSINNLRTSGGRTVEAVILSFKESRAAMLKRNKSLRNKRSSHRVSYC